MKNRIYIISPVYNEEAGIIQFLEKLSAVIQKYELDAQCVLVNDGSTDNTSQTIQSSHNNPNINIPITTLGLSRNFGQQAALQAGLEYVFQKAFRSDFFILIDSDLQQSPELIIEMLKKLETGYDHIQMIRNDNHTTGFTKKITSFLFYKVFKNLSELSISPGSSDFRAFNYSFLKAYLELRERNRFNRGLFHWLGFKTIELHYNVEKRDSGESKYTFSKMLKLSLNAILQFSSKPLIYVTSGLVTISFGTCILYFMYELKRYLNGETFVLGWTSIMFFVAFWSGLILLTQLILALYVSKIFNEIKQRPVYIVRDINEIKKNPANFISSNSQS